MVFDHETGELAMSTRTREVSIGCTGDSHSPPNQKPKERKLTCILLIITILAVLIAIYQAANTGMKGSNVPLGLAVLFGLAGVISGCRRLSQLGEIAYANDALESVKTGHHPLVGDDPDAVGPACEELRRKIRRISGEARREQIRQIVCLAISLLSFAVWFAL
jgi:hypothetical protein